MKLQKSVTIPRPHFEWGQPTDGQKKALIEYIAKGGSMSIYGDDGIYQQLETWIGDYYSTPYVILTNTGTSALNSGYVGLGITVGDEVLVPTYTFLATVTPLLRLGAVPVFVDADAKTGNINPRDLEAKITPRTKAIAVTHMWGIPCDMEAVMKVAKEHNLKVLEDCSHAHFTMSHGKLLGTFGDVACFSIGAKKTLTSGEGGFLLTKDPEIYLRATLLGHFEVRALDALSRIESEGHTDVFNKYKGYETGFGENYRMHPYSAVMSYALLESGEIFDLIEKRRSSLKYFTERLNQCRIIKPPVFDDDFYTGAMYGYKAQINTNLITIPVGEVVDLLKQANLEIKQPDSSPLHEKKLFSNLNDIGIGYGENPEIKGDFLGAKEYFTGRVSLPTFSRGIELDREVIDQYIEVIKELESVLNIG